MLKKWLLICLLLFVVVGCAPAATETSDSTHDEGEVHDDHEDEDDHGDEDDHEHRELGAHEHGAAELMIALSGDQIDIVLETPAFNVVGFEYAPESATDKTLFDESITLLESATLLQINSDALCTVTSAEAETERDEADDDSQTHSEIIVSYLFDCEEPGNISSLDATDLFAQFPNFEDIDVQWVSDTQQSATELTASNAVVMFE